MDWFMTPQGAATVAFALLVVIPLAKKLAKRTATPVDDQAVSLLERVLSVIGLGRK